MPLPTAGIAVRSAQTHERQAGSAMNPGLPPVADPQQHPLDRSLLANTDLPTAWLHPVSSAFWRDDCEAPAAGEGSRSLLAGKNGPAQTLPAAETATLPEGE